MWLYLGVCSALFLGLYDISKKHSLQKNSVLPVLFYSSICASIITVIAVVCSRVWPEMMAGINLYIPEATAKEHLLLFIKSGIAFSSWMLSFSALKRLPISIATPIGTSGPLWTMLGAVLIFHEHPTTMQVLGLATMIGSYYLYSVIGNKEGIRFSGNKWVWFIVAATLIGTCSALYDKYLIQTRGISPLTVQAWFFIYLVVMLVPATLGSKILQGKNYQQFVWRWSVPLIGLFLIGADFAYFRALSYQGSMVAILATLRCSCVVISFVGGIVLFRELQPGYKAVALTGVLAGVFLILTA
ncbi:MAG: EamA-like transporter family protein [Planctomycetes bacterium ADurb.Bin401]|nr:MAG: EamA-like transporter family protein [Planctomycetes bacterium ADurb.Bin401]